MKINGVQVEMSPAEMYFVLFREFGGYFGPGFYLKDAVNAYLSLYPCGKGIHEPHKCSKYVAARLYWSQITKPRKQNSPTSITSSSGGQSRII